MPTPLSCITHPTHAGHGLLGERVAQQAGKVIARELCNGKLRTTRLGSIPEAEMHSIMLDAFRRGHESALCLYNDPPNSVEYPKGPGMCVCVALP
eukprot:jgi/Chrzof1/12/Cz01g00130.t1